MLDIVRLRILAKGAQAAQACGQSLDGFTLIDTDDPAPAAVAQVREGRARLLMKGQIATPTLMRAMLDPEKGLRTGRVRLAGFQSALATLVPHAAASLRRDHPGIELHLADAHPQVALNLLRAGQADAALIFRYDDTTPGDIRATHLFDDPMYLLSLQPGQTLPDHRDSDWIAGCEHLQRRCRVVGLAHLIAELFEQRCRDRLHLCVILDQQHRFAGLRGLFRRFRRHDRAQTA